MTLTRVSHKRDNGEQCRSRSDSGERPGSSLFALNAGISVKHGNKKKFHRHPLYWTILNMDRGTCVHGLETTGRTQFFNVISKSDW